MLPKLFETRTVLSSTMQTMEESCMHRGATERKDNGLDEKTFPRI